VARTHTENKNENKNAYWGSLIAREGTNSGEFLRYFKTHPGMGKGQHLQFVQIGLITNCSASKM